MRTGSASAAAKRERLVSPWLIAGLFGATIFAFVLLFPAPALKRELARAHSVNAVILDYLQLLVRASPQAHQARLLLAKKALQVHDTALAKVALEPWLRQPIADETRRVGRLRLELEHNLVYSSPAGSATRNERITRWSHMLRALRPRLGYDQLIATAHNARALGLYRDAATLAFMAIHRTHDANARRQAFRYGLASLVAGNLPGRALKAAARYRSAVPMTADLWVYLAQIALAANAAEQAAAYELHYLAVTTTPQGRRRALLAALRALIAAGRPCAALATAAIYLHRIPPDAALWRFLTRLALASDRPRLAAHYAAYLVGLTQPGT